jgi:hypothetical protein
MASHYWRIEFLQSLSTTKKLVHKGESSSSRLIQELSWKDKMFGAFTKSEVRAVSDWIDNLPPLEQVYWNFIGEPQRISADVFRNQNIAADYPVFISRAFPECIPDPWQHPQLQKLDTPLKDIDKAGARAKNIELRRLLPLWFAHPALLESFAAIPSKTATVLGCSILRIIRAQSGFGLEGHLMRCWSGGLLSLQERC